MPLLLLSKSWRLLAYEAFNRLYDYPFYMWMVYKLGPIGAAPILVLGSLLSCGYLFWRYDKQKIDWLWAKAVRDLDTQQEKNRLERFIYWVIEKLRSLESKRFGNFFSALRFVLANIFTDPLIVAIHYRESHFNGISRKDWQIFLWSVAVANLWWLLRTWGIVGTATWLWEKL